MTESNTGKCGACGRRTVHLLKRDDLSSVTLCDYCYYEDD